MSITGFRARIVLGSVGTKSVSHCVDATLVFARGQPFNGLVGAILFHHPSNYSGLLLPVQRSREQPANQPANQLHRKAGMQTHKLI